MDRLSPPPPVATPYRVSTITAVGSVCSALDIRLVFQHVRVDGGANVQGADRVMCARLGGETRGNADCDANAGASAKKSRRKDSGKKPPPPSCFGNQVTLVMSVGGTRVNLKAFSNGRVQLTGVKAVALGLRAIDVLVAELKEICSASPDALAVADASVLHAADYRVCLINSDLDLGFQVKRDLLHGCLRDMYPDTQVSYEPCIYQGLKIKFMWNDDPASPSTPRGQCTCACAGETGQPRTCIGRGDGHTRGQCRKVTVAVFQSGKVIITGAHTTKQIDDAYRFLVSDVVACHADRFRRPATLPPVSKGHLRNNAESVLAA
jgi:TATA-box binding protein (TBP) (component of TFIID and TFIIIB)